MNVIQGNAVILSFLGPSGYEPFVCLSSVSVEIESDELQTRTVGDGQWKKVTYQALSYTINLSGVMVFANPDENPTLGVWDLLQNQMTGLTIGFRINYEDDDTPTNINSMQGVVLVKTTSIASVVGEVVKGTIQLTGSGPLVVFSGLTPCDTTINSITVNGQEGNSGTVAVDYTYTGDLYQVMYTVDGGAPAYGVAGAELDIPGLPIGNHSITIVPICSNGFQGTGLTQSFVVTQAFTCPSVITLVTVNTSTLTATATLAPGGTATQMIYTIDGGIGVPIPQTVPIGSVISFPGIGAGAHTITCIPLCTLPNGSTLQGTGFTQNFTIVATPTQAILNYSFVNSGASLQGSNFQIFVNGLLTVVGTPNSSGSISVPVGATIRAAFNGAAARSGQYTPPYTAVLSVVDATTSTTLSDQTASGIITSLTYTFTASPHTYTITETFS